jgi:hypothetical protein
MSTYRTHPYQRAAKETSRLMLRLGNGCDELNVVTGNGVTLEICAKASRTIAHVTPRRNFQFRSSCWFLWQSKIGNLKSNIAKPHR